MAAFATEERALCLEDEGSTVWLKPGVEHDCLTSGEPLRLKRWGDPFDDEDDVSEVVRITAGCTSNDWAWVDASDLTPVQPAGSTFSLKDGVWTDAAAAADPPTQDPPAVEAGAQDDGANEENSSEEAWAQSSVDDETASPPKKRRVIRRLGMDQPEQAAADQDSSGSGDEENSELEAEDGDSEEDPKSDVEDLTVGTPVEVYWNGEDKWYPATIRQIHPVVVVVGYADGDSKNTRLKKKFYNAVPDRPDAKSYKQKNLEFRRRRVVGVKPPQRFGVKPRRASSRVRYAPVAWGDSVVNAREERSARAQHVAAIIPRV